MELNCEYGEFLDVSNTDVHPKFLLQGLEFNEFFPDHLDCDV